MALSGNVGVRFVRRLLHQSSRIVWPTLTTHKRHQSNLIRIEEEKDICTLFLKSPPVNSINLELVQAVTDALQEMENKDTCRGLIITSDMPDIFSAGIDLSVMYPMKAERFDEFWRAFQRMWMSLYGSRLATIAAINGHSPAGGCLLSMSCDYRVMASGKYKIGLNEAQIGILIPFWFQDLMKKIIGQRETERALQLGYMFPSQEALRVGLVDHVTEKAKLLDTAKIQMRTFLRSNDEARHGTKLELRKPLIAELQARADEDVNGIIKFLSHGAIQKGIGRYLEGLQTRAK